MDQPSMRELVDAVREFLETRAMPELKGHTAFHARVAANALAIVARELEQGPSRDPRKRRRACAALLGRDGTLEDTQPRTVQAHPRRRHSRSIRPASSNIWN